jgi:VacB/RNase II family 3'-5' exoribonuclease
VSFNNSPIDLTARAHQAMLDAGFQPDFSPEVMREAASAKPNPVAGPAEKVQDLRGLLWSSIDNDTSRDLDQVEYAEKLADGTTRLLVGIADVDASVPAGSATDQHAASETTAVYASAAVFPMLPDALSTDRTSLLDDQERQAMVVELRIADSGEVTCHDVFRARIRNRAKLAYSSTGAWLEGGSPMPAAIARVPGMEAQLRLQADLAQKLRNIRKEQGALTFSSVEPMPVKDNGQIKGLAFSKHNIASDIIESFMVAANVAMAQYLKEKHSLSIRRVVRTPKRWDRIQAIAAEFGVKLPAQPDPRALSAFLDQRKAADALHFPDLSLSVVKLLGAGEYIVEHAGEEHEGHFGLAVQDYSHSTAPNRRYADLITQRLLKAAADGVPTSYNEAQLAQVAARCTDREDAARKVERLMRKIVAANLLSHQIGQEFDGVITGATPKGTYARLLKFPAEGMVVRGARGVDVGDRVRLRLTGVSVDKGFIDFERK